MAHILAELYSERLRLYLLYYKYGTLRSTLLIWFREMLSRQSGAISMLHALSTHTADEVRGFSKQVEALNSSLAQFIAKPGPSMPLAS